MTFLKKYGGDLDETDRFLLQVLKKMPPNIERHFIEFIDHSTKQIKDSIGLLMAYSASFWSSLSLLLSFFDLLF